MTRDWHKSQTFTSRLASISRIQEAYVQAHGLSIESGSNGRQLESKAFQEAASLAEYDARIEQIVSELGGREITGNILSEQFKSADAIAEDLIAACPAKSKFGRYTGAVQCNRGLFSTIFVAAEQSISAHEHVQSSIADDSSKGRHVALKATTLAAVRSPHDAAREARIMQRAVCKTVMPILDSFYDGAGHYILVMPFTPFTLEQLLNEEHSRREHHMSTQAVYLVPRNLKRTLRDLFKALAHIHKLGIIHRDVKPSNILLSTPHGPAYLSDFGIAWCPSDGGSESANRKISDVGTTCYRAPEVLFGDTAYDSKLDMWAAGCVVAEALLGGSRTLFSAGDAGSELTLIMNMFDSLGTPNSLTWPELSRLPDWGKMHFKEFAAKNWVDLLPQSGENGRSLVEQLIRYSDTARWTADQALAHTFFHDLEHDGSKA